MDVPVKFGGSMLNIGRIIQLFAAPAVLRTFFAVFNCILQPTGKHCDIIAGSFVRPIVFDEGEKFRDPCPNRSREIPPEVVGCGIFDSFFSL